MSEKIKNQKDEELTRCILDVFEAIGKYPVITTQTVQSVEIKGLKLEDNEFVRKCMEGIAERKGYVMETIPLKNIQSIIIGYRYLLKDTK